MKFSKIFYFLLLMGFSCPTTKAAEKIESPNGKTTVVVDVNDGHLSYQVSHNDVVFIEPSSLGLKTNVDDLTQGLSLKSCATTTVNDAYDLKTIKQRHVDYVATEAVCQVEKDGRHVMDVIFRVSDRDVAFRYKLYPKRDTRVAVVEYETSGFVMPEGTTTFLCPQSKPMGGFARTSPSYETSYTLDDEMGKNGWARAIPSRACSRTATRDGCSSARQAPTAPMWVAA